LQGRLSLAGEQSKLSDATIGVILAVSDSPQVAGEYELAKDHVGSLQKIIELRNVVHIQGHNPRLLVGIFRPVDRNGGESFVCSNN